MKPLPAADIALPDAGKYWWERTDLGFSNGELCFAGHSVDALARWSDRPVFLYSGERALANVARLQAALDSAGVSGSVLLAIKANRFPPLLTTLARSGRCGVDVCSPKEIKAALSAGFSAETISFTATSLSDDDIASLARHPTIAINLDSLSALRRFGERAPGRTIGLRINPEVGVGGSAKLTYSGRKPTKFGIYPEQWSEALAIVRDCRLRVSTLHVHAGCGYLTEQLANWRAAIDRALLLRPSLPEISTFNVGGGLGVPHTATWGSLDLRLWAEALQQSFAKTGLSVLVEPGDFIVKDAGLLVLKVNGVEDKGGTRFASVNGGFNLAPEPVFYDLPCEPVPCRLRAGRDQRVTLAGNINEALDLWYEDIMLPPLMEGDGIAFLNAGGYASAMSSNHCLRGDFEEILVPQP